MELSYLDGLTRGAAGALLLLLAVFFTRDSRHSQTARLGAPLCLSGIAYLTMLAVPPCAAWRWWQIPVHLVSLAGPGLFWLFVESWFDDEFVVRPRFLVAIAASMLVGISGGVGIQLQMNWIAFHLFSLIFIVLGLWAALRGRNGDLIESRRRIRLMLAVEIGLIVFLIMVSEIPNTGTGTWPPPIWLRLFNAVSLLAVALTVTTLTLGWRDTALLSPPARAPIAPDRADAPDDAPLLAALEHLMRYERLYRQDGLTITAVAARLGVPEYRLRRAINQGSGARNFNAFLNAYRLEEVEQALRDAEQREVPILTIALDSGFGSLAPFNRAFRLAKGMTPTEFRQAHL